MPSNGRPCIVLLVEDSDDHAFLFQKLLTGARNFKLAWHARNGAEAIDYLAGTGAFRNRRKYPFPHAMALDLQLPLQDGFEVLQWLDGRFPGLKVGIFTNSDDPKDIERALELGAHLFQTKTFASDKFARFLEWLSKGDAAQLRTRSASAENTTNSAQSVAAKARQLGTQTTRLCEHNKKLREYRELLRKYLDGAMAESKESRRQFPFPRRRLGTDWGNRPFP